MFFALASLAFLVASIHFVAIIPVL
jgi:hypothetical protein